jgi:hypothetical protein
MAKAPKSKKSTTNTPRGVTVYSLAVDAWRASNHKVDVAVKLLIAEIKRHPFILDTVIEQRALAAITNVKGHTRKAIMAPTDIHDVQSHVLPSSVTVVPASSVPSARIRTSQLIERDLMDYHVQRLNKRLGDAKPEEVQVAIDSGVAGANKALATFGWLKDVITTLAPKQGIPIRQQTTASDLAKLARTHGIYKDLAA